jgi:hypothetical protein
MPHYDPKVFYVMYYIHKPLIHHLSIEGWVFNTTFTNISVTTFVAEIGVPREINRPVASHWQHLSHNVLSSTPRHEWGSNSQLKWWWVTIAHVFVYNYHSTTTAQVQLRWKVIVLLILMEFMIITVYNLSFHINQWKELVCWKYVFCWGSLDGICISCEVPSIVDTTLGISEQYLFFCHQTGMIGHWI